MSSNCQGVNIKKEFLKRKDMNLDSVILMGCVIGTSVILVLVMVILWRYIRSLTIKTRVEDRQAENKMVAVQVLQSPVKLHESVMMLAEEGLYQGCVTSTPHVHRSHSLTSDDSSDVSSSSSASSSDSKSVRTLCRPHMFGSTYIVDKAEQDSVTSEDLTEGEKSQQHQTFTVTNFDQRLEEALQNESTVVLEEEEDKETTIIIVNEEEEFLEEENNNCEESFLKEKYLMHQTISDSMINITFG